MEVVVPQPKPLTLEDYFALERRSETRYEYHGPGRVIAMAGGSVAHATVATNVSGELRSRLAEKPCRAFNEAMRIYVRRVDRYFYPDASALCGELDIDRAGGLESLANPQLIVEVLSPSTERNDRLGKCDAYMQIESLREYVLIEQHEARATVLSRNLQNGWSFETVVGLDATLKLKSVGIEIPLRAIYQNVEFPPPEQVEGAASTATTR